MDSHDVIIADRDGKLGEWSESKLKEGYTACHLEVTRLEQEKNEDAKARLSLLRFAMVAARAALDSKVSAARHRKTLRYAQAGAVIALSGLGLRLITEVHPKADPKSAKENPQTKPSPLSISTNSAPSKATGTNQVTTNQAPPNKQ